MSDFQEPEVLATFDRSWKSQKEQLRLERSEFHGRPVYALRVYWQNDAGEWRWSPAKATTSGRHWQAFSLKQRELRLLGLALLAEADELEREHASAPSATPTPQAQREPRPTRTPNAHDQRQIDRLDAEHPIPRSTDDIPF